MKFKNLKKLILIGVKDLDYYLISKFKFPKLEFVNLENLEHFNYPVPLSFICQTKILKQSSYNGSTDYLCESLDWILSLHQLTDLVLAFGQFDHKFGNPIISNYNLFNEWFDILSKHKSLINIKFEVHYYFLKFHLLNPPNRTIQNRSSTRTNDWRWIFLNWLKSCVILSNPNQTGNPTFKKVEHGTGIFMLLGLKSYNENSIQNCIKFFWKLTILFLFKFFFNFSSSKITFRWLNCARVIMLFFGWNNDSAHSSLKQLFGKANC